MALRDLRCLFTAAALACAALPAAAAPCKQPAYPRSAVRNLEEGITLLGFLIRVDGTVAGSTILNSSGSAALDQAAQEALSKCVLKPAIEDGKPVERWAPVMYKWTMADDMGMSRAKRRAAQAASDGSPAARYHLGLLMSSTARTDAEREEASTMLRSAAELGVAHAQFDLGRRLEKLDAEEARRWYEKAAAQGDVFAVQRLARWHP